MNFDLINTNLMDYLFEGGFGLEMETLRITSNGKLSQTQDPFLSNSKIDKDFSENQIEFITSVSKSNKEALIELTELQNQVRSKLLLLNSGPEYLWPFSNPPYIESEEEIPIARYGGKLKHKENYRKYLAKKYGKKKMLFSGIHYNFSFSEELLKILYENTIKQQSYQSFKNELYLDLSKKVTYYSWLIVYLTAASSVIDYSLFDDDICGEYASYRCSEYGYWNYFVPLFDYSSFDKYIQSIQMFVDKKMIVSPSELYYPVRLKGKNDNSLSALCKGVDHIELRMIDINPLYKEGLSLNDLEFIHYLLVYFILSPKLHLTFEEQKDALLNEKNSSLLVDEEISIKLNKKSINIVDAGITIMNHLELFYDNLNVSKAVNIIKYQKNKFLNPKERYAYQIKRIYQENYLKKGLKLAKSNSSLIKKVK